MGLQFAQGPRDADLALREAGGQRFDRDAGAGRERLDVSGQADRREGELAVLEQVVADHRVASRVPDVHVPYAATACGYRA
ncbi:hypothetical protein [Streptomyces sp. KL116D]|uniref:hypothetical protein n=1 Tax=Streptomyces sp. KL116D TaxID=3045152 RepID=UPI0035564E70